MSEIGLWSENFDFILRIQNFISEFCRFFSQDLGQNLDFNPRILTSISELRPIFSEFTVFFLKIQILMSEIHLNLRIKTFPLRILTSRLGFEL